MAYQTIYNPATGQIQVMDLSQSDAQQKIMALYQQGWTSATAQQTQYAQQQAPQAYQPQPVEPKPTQQAISPIAPGINPLTYGPQQKEPKKEPGYILTDVDQPRRGETYTTKGVDVVTYVQLPESEKWKYHIVAKKLSTRDYERLGPGAEKYAELRPTTLEKVAQVADTVAIMAVPLYDTIKNWDEKDTKGRIFSIGMDALCIIPSAWFATRTVSATVRAGGTVSKGVTTAIKNEILAPFYMIRHPIQTFKAPFVTVKELVSKKYVPYEAVVGSIKSPAGRYGMSDVRMGVRAGLEEAGATREAMATLQRDIIAGSSKATTMQGVRRVEMTPTGVQQILGSGIADHATPAFENMLTALEQTGKATKGQVGILGRETTMLQPGQVLVRGREGGLYAAGTGTLFHQGSALGGSGQISAHVLIDTAGEGVSRLPRSVAKYQDVAKMEKAGARVLGAGESADEIVPGIKIYKETAEGEVIVANETKLVVVPSGKPTTFKWNVPKPEIVEQATQTRQQLQAVITKMEEASKSGRQPVVKQLEGQAETLIKKIKELDDKAVKLGTPKSVTLDIDHVKMIDPMSGQETLVVHMAPEGVNAKPWTQGQISALKKKGYLNIPRDIVEPALKYPHISPEEQISLIRRGLNSGEQARMDAGLELSNQLFPQNVSTHGLRVDIGKVEVFSDVKPQVAKDIEKVLQKYNQNSRVYGSIVEQTYTGKTIAGDIDIAADMRVAKPIAEDIGKIMEANGYQTRVKMIDAERGLGGAGFGIEIKKGDEWVKIADIRDLAEHSKPITYGMPTGQATNIGGISIETPSEAFNRRLAVMLFPGFGLQGAGYVGPVAAFKLNRMKDIPRARMLADTLVDSLHAEAMSLTGNARTTKLNQERRLRQAIETLFKGQLDNITEVKGQGATRAFDDYEKAFLKASDNLDVYDSIRRIENRVAMPYEQRYKLPLGNIASVRAENVAMRGVMGLAATQQPVRPSRAEVPTERPPAVRVEDYTERPSIREDIARDEGIRPEERQPRLEREEVTPREERIPREERPPEEPRPPRDERVTRVPDEPRAPRPPREERIPDEPTPPRRGKDREDTGLRIERVEGIPRNPGIVSHDKGIVHIEYVPPYREGREDIHFTKLKKPRTGKGSQEKTLKVRGGKAPKLIVVSRLGGIAKTDIIKGRRMVHTRQRGPGILTSSGKFRRVRRGSVI